MEVKATTDPQGWVYVKSALDTSHGTTSPTSKTKVRIRTWFREQIPAPSDTNGDALLRRRWPDGSFTFELLTVTENQRQAPGSSNFSSSSLTPFDPAPFTSASGAASVDRYRSIGYLSPTQFCVWQSPWKADSEWEYAESFRNLRLADDDATHWKRFSPDQDIPAQFVVRRRHLRQICQIAKVMSEEDIKRIEQANPAATSASVTATVTPVKIAEPTPKPAIMATPAAKIPESKPFSPDAHSTEIKAFPPYRYVFHNHVFALPIDQLFRLLSKDNSEFLQKFNIKKEYSPSPS